MKGLKAFNDHSQKTFMSKNSPTEVESNLKGRSGLLKINRLSKKICVLVFFSVLTLQSMASNYIDSDLSNNAGTNKNWHNIFWFLLCVSFLIASAVIGSRRKYTRIRRTRPTED